MKRKREFKPNPSFSGKNKSNTSNYISDPKLVPRLQQYLDSQKNKQVVNLSLAADDLQFRFGDYSRKNKTAFKKSVEKAYEFISGKQSDPELKRRKKESDKETSEVSSDSDCDSFSDENPEYAVYENKNKMNSFMTDLYMKNPKRQGSQPSSAAASPTRKDGSKKKKTNQHQRMKSVSAPSSPLHRNNEDTNDGSMMFTIDRTGNRNVSNLVKSDRVTVEVDSLDSSSVANLLEETSKVQDVKNMKSQEPGGFVDSPLREDGAVRQESQTESKESANQKTPGKRKVRKKTGNTEEEEKKKGPQITQSTVTFADVGGNEKTLKEICKLLVHMKHPEVYQQLGVTPPRGFLLHGPPGCGKTLLANAIAGELELPYIKMAATEIVSGVSGESEEKLRDVFDKAIACAPCIIFLDEIDAITPKRETASKDMERRIVSQLLTCMDDLNTATAHVLVIGATNRPDSIDPALRRAGRFDREICLGIPDEKARMRILQVLCRGLSLSGDFDFAHLAKNTPGYVGADMMALAREAAMTAVNRVFNELRIIPPHEKITENTQETIDTTKPSSINEQQDLKMQETLTKVNSSDERLECIQEDTIEINSVSEGSSKTEADPTNKSDKKIENQKNEDDVKNKQLDEEKEVNLLSIPIEATTNESSSLEKVKNIYEDSELNSVLTWLKDQPPLTVEQLANMFITMEDFEAAVKVVQPSAKREGFATIPDVTWKDIGALQDVREELQMAILAPVRHPEQFKALGLTNPPGVLLAGPPGCGKTMLAKAVANESGINFISVKGPELLNMYVGESERAVRQVFQRARNSSPCVIFFDELDALCPKRSGSGEGGASVRVVNQLLTEMDGLEERKQVFIMGATNRPDIIDPAVLRPGRLDKILYVGLPTAQDRLDILKTLTKNGTKPKLSNVNLNDVAESEKCNGFTGADLAALVREASTSALREFMGQSNMSVESLEVTDKHFEIALQKVRPSVSDKDQIIYKKMRENVAGK